MFFQKEKKREKKKFKVSTWTQSFFSNIVDYFKRVLCRAFIGKDPSPFPFKLFFLSHFLLNFRLYSKDGEQKWDIKSVRYWNLPSTVVRVSSRCFVSLPWRKGYHLGCFWLLGKYSRDGGVGLVRRLTVSPSGSIFLFPSLGLIPECVRISGLSFIKSETTMNWDGDITPPSVSVVRLCTRSNTRPLWNKHLSL